MGQILSEIPAINAESKKISWDLQKWRSYSRHHPLYRKTRVLKRKMVWLPRGTWYWHSGRNCQICHMCTKHWQSCRCPSARATWLKRCEWPREAGCRPRRVGTCSPWPIGVGHWWTQWIVEGRALSIVAHRWWRRASWALRHRGQLAGGDLWEIW